MKLDSSLWQMKVLAIVGEPSLIEAYDQICNLYDADLISKPDFQYERITDSDGHKLWFCSCDVIEAPEYGEGYGETKLEAKIDACYQTLLLLLNYDEDKIYEIKKENKSVLN